MKMPMLKDLISIPVMLLLSVLQMAAISRINLINGAADLVLLAIAAWGVKEKSSNVYVWAVVGGLLISFITGMPLLSPLIPYLFSAFITCKLAKILWQSPLLALIVSMIAGTLFQHFFYIVILQISGLNIGFIESMVNVTLPSLLLNFFFMFPVYVVINDIWVWTSAERINA